MSNLGPRAHYGYQAIRDRILACQWPPKARLSSITDLAAQFGVAPVTIRQALVSLKDEGLISTFRSRSTLDTRTSPTSVADYLAARMADGAP